MKVAVTTDASAGIGFAIVERFARAGWTIAILAGEPARFRQAKMLLERAGGTVCQTASKTDP